ncbi:hypothetical protein K490DRAFT_53630 [Saccharata proteae CBS 121410]|uniref:RRM domain-containing protein n=1 Tax=Saccharata proteae CBS 121410 TaxID=1314787 RepID=A0A9P4HWS5_9PEZI|nr:hypothetical protein K490DRAFT_53630 [Saccharata proteae CBS 121410]
MKAGIKRKPPTDPMFREAVQDIVNANVTNSSLDQGIGGEIFDGLSASDESEGRRGEAIALQQMPHQLQKVQQQEKSQSLRSMRIAIPGLRTSAPAPSPWWKILPGLMNHPSTSRQTIFYRVPDLYIGGLKRGTTKNDLLSFLTDYNVATIVNYADQKVKAHRAPQLYAFVKLVNPADHQRVITEMDGKYLNGWSVCVEYAKHSSRAPEASRDSIQEAPACEANPADDDFIKESAVDMTWLSLSFDDTKIPDLTKDMLRKIIGWPNDLFYYHVFPEIREGISDEDLRSTRTEMEKEAYMRWLGLDPDEREVWAKCHDDFRSDSGKVACVSWLNRKLVSTLAEHVIGQKTRTIASSQRSRTASVANSHDLEGEGILQRRLEAQQSKSGSANDITPAQDQDHEPYTYEYSIDFPAIRPAASFKEELEETLPAASDHWQVMHRGPVVRDPDTQRSYFPVLRLLNGELSLYSAWHIAPTEAPYNECKSLHQSFDELGRAIGRVWQLDLRAGRTKLDSLLREWVLIHPYSFPELAECPFYILAFEKDRTPFFDRVLGSKELTYSSRLKVVSQTIGYLRIRMNLRSNPQQAYNEYANGKTYDILKGGLHRELNSFMNEAQNSEGNWQQGKVKLHFEKVLRPFMFANRSRFPELENTTVVQAWEDASGLKWMDMRSRLRYAEAGMWREGAGLPDLPGFCPRLTLVNMSTSHRNKASRTPPPIEEIHRTIATMGVARDKSPVVLVSQRPAYSIDKDPYNPLNMTLAELGSCLTRVLCREPKDKGFRKAIQDSINASIGPTYMDDWSERVILDQLEARGASPDQLAAADFLIREEMRYKNTWILADQFNTPSKLSRLIRDIKRAAEVIHGFSLDREGRQMERKPRAALNLMDDSPARDPGHASGEDADLTEDDSEAPSPEITTPEDATPEDATPEDAIPADRLPVVLIPGMFTEEEVIELTKKEARLSKLPFWANDYTGFLAGHDSDTQSSEAPDLQDALSETQDRVAAVAVGSADDDNIEMTNEEQHPSSFPLAAQDHGEIDPLEASDTEPPQVQAMEAATLLRIGGIGSQTTEEDVLDLLKGSCEVASIRLSYSGVDAYALVSLVEGSAVQGVAALRRRTINGHKLQVQWVFEQMPTKYPQKKPLAEWNMRSETADMIGDNYAAPYPNAPVPDSVTEVEIAERIEQGISTTPVSGETQDTAGRMEDTIFPDGDLLGEHVVSGESSDNYRFPHARRGSDLSVQLSSSPPFEGNPEATEMNSFSEDDMPMSDFTWSRQNVNAGSEQTGAKRLSKKTAVRSDEEEDLQDLLELQALVESISPTYDLLTDGSNFETPLSQDTIEAIIESLKDRWVLNTTEQAAPEFSRLFRELTAVNGGTARRIKILTERKLRMWVYKKPHFFPELVMCPFFINAFDIDNPSVLNYLKPEVPLTPDNGLEILSAIMDKLRAAELPYVEGKCHITYYDGRHHPINDDRRGMADILIGHLRHSPEARRWANGGAGIARLLEMALRPFVFVNRKRFPELREARFVKMWEEVSGLEW